MKSAVLLIVCCALSFAQEPAEPKDLIARALPELLKMQEEGAWPYEGVYRVKGEIPVGYRIGGTSIVGSALLHVAHAEDVEAAAAIDRGVEFVLKALDDPLMQPSTKDAYDVRIWGHACALEFLCHLKKERRTEEVDKKIRWLVETIEKEEIEGGGWNYATRRQQAVFVTAPVVQSLLYAREQGSEVSDDILRRAGDVIEKSRLDSGAFVYSGAGSKNGKRGGGSEVEGVQGSIARAPVAEATLLLLGRGSVDHLRESLESFVKYWDELEKRRKQTGTHAAPHGIAPYYFYYGHRYAAQAIEMLPEKERPGQRRKLLELILKTRDEDGTWNDRVFPRSRNFGTAMIVLALLSERTPTPVPLSRKK